MEGTYRHLTFEEPRTLFRLLNAKVPIQEIATQLGRHRSTIYREIAHIADAAGGIDWDVQWSAAERAGLSPVTAPALPEAIEMMPSQ